MKIVAGSDIHGLLVEPNDMPQGDVLSLCGDIIPLDVQKSLVKSIAWFHMKFYPWVKSLPYDKIFFIGGNHDFFLEHLHKKFIINNNEFIWNDSYNVMETLFCDEYEAEVSNKLVYLCDNSIEYKGVMFYGTPYISNLTNWAFYRSNDELIELYNKIPNCDVLLTHQPPKVGDIGRVLENGWNSLKNFGSQDLYEVIKERDIKWSLSGHVHSGSHDILTDNGTNFVNVSILNEKYNRSYKWFEFEI